MSFTKQQRDSRGRIWYFSTGETLTETASPLPRRDYYSARRWKDQPLRPGEQPFVVHGDGVVDLHPSQWKDTTHGR